jgi:hypothetical protein
MNPRWNFTATLEIENLIDKEIEFSVYHLNDNQKEILIG